jgi:hypothetical protein
VEAYTWHVLKRWQGNRKVAAIGMAIPALYFVIAAVVWSKPYQIALAVMWTLLAAFQLVMGARGRKSR